MLKTKLRFTAWVFLIVFFFASGTFATGIANAQTSRQEDSQIPIVKALKDVTRVYNTQFVYEKSLLDGKTTDLTMKDIKKGKKVEDVLKSILYPKKLVFLYIKENYYTIVSRDRLEQQHSYMVKNNASGNDEGMQSGNSSNVNSHSVSELTDIPFAAHIVKGQVTNSKGEPLVGVSITVKGTGIGTSSDNEGSYSIDVPEDGTLIFSYVGFATREIKVNNRSAIEVVMEASVSELDQVVVVGYGTQKKINLTGAISTIDSKSLENRAVGTLSEALQGEAPGLKVIRTGGQPGKSNISLQIRGNSTFTDNPPLTIIDGVPSSISTINPNDIESISVLKDAASSAIYGARAAGGVILITTKAGRVGKTQVTYDGYVGIEKVSRLPQKVTAFQHATLYREAELNDNPNTTVFKFTDEDLARFSASDWKDYDRYDVIFRNAIQTQHNISVSGGTTKQNYFLSVGYLNQEGIVINTGYKKFNTRFHQNIQLGKKFKIGFIGSYDPSETIAPSEANYPGGPARGLNNLISWGVYRRGNYLPIFAPNGQWASVEGVASVIGLASKDGGQQILKSNRASGNFSLDYDVSKYLKISAMYGINYTQSRQRDYSKKMEFYNPVTPDVIDVNVDHNALLVNNSSATFESAKLLANYTRTIGSHAFSILGGYTQEYSYQENERVGRRDFLTDNIYSIGAGSSDPSTWTTSGGMSDWALSSFIARGTYSYKGKYLAEASMRYDGSSRFIKDVRWGFFPSVSAGWRVTEEDFLKDNRVLTNLKIRASWGEVGNQNVGNYPFASTLSTSSYYFNGLPQTAVYTSGAPNPELSWETKTATNIGVDGNIFGKLLGFTIDVFKERTRDILLTVPLPTTYGQTAPVQNAGIVDNKGWEIQLTHQNIINNFKYGISIQTSNSSEKVIDLKGTGPWISGNTITEEGHPMNEWYGWRSEGFFQTDSEVAAHSFQNVKTSPGDIIYQENGGDPKTIDANDRVRLGRSDIRFPYGIRINLGYKNFDLIAFGQGVMKHTVWINGWTAANFDRAQSTIFTYHLDRWTPETPNAKFPKTRVGGVNNKEFSSYWLQNGAYFRMKNIQLGYSLSENILNKLKISRARIYVSSENLFTITSLLGFDPEIATGISARQVETRYPFSKVYNFGLNLTF